MSLATRDNNKHVQKVKEQYNQYRWYNSILLPRLENCHFSRQNFKTLVYVQVFALA